VMDWAASGKKSEKQNESEENKVEYIAHALDSYSVL
jgi:hypothetical protein